jgi:dTDP-4-amino-4,6-dideoxygalactose transaminase
MWSYKDHGKNYQAVYQKEHPPGFRWLHESFGSNYRMIEIQGAIGRIQLKKMAEWTRLRNVNAQALQSVAQEFSGKDGLVRAPKFRCGSCSAPISEQCSQGCMHAQYKVYFYIQPENLAEGWSRDRIIEEINRRGIPCYQGSCSEVYLEKAFDGTGFRPKESLPNAKQLGDTSIMFLVHPTLTNEEIQLTQSAMREVFYLGSKATV